MTIKVTRNERYVDMEMMPELAEFLEALFMKMPSLSFEASDYYVKHIANAEYDSNASQVKPRETQTLIRQVKVFNGFEEVGRAAASYEYYRSDKNILIYTIESNRLRSKRRRSGYHKTRDAKEAMKSCIKSFGSSEDTVMALKFYEYVKGEADNMLYWATRSISRIINGDDLEVLQCLMAYHKKDLTAATIPLGIRQALDDPKTMNEIRTAEIAKNMRFLVDSRNGVIVCDIKGSLLLIDTGENSLKRLSSTYDLSELHQSKLAMLKIVDFRQPVESIGFKCLQDEDTAFYFLSNGDILTTC